jgi:hypothetical protein
MITKFVAASLLSICLFAPASAQNSRSPSGDPSGSTKGVASDTDPVGKAVGNEPAMVDPHSTGSVKLDSRAKVECMRKTADGKTIITHHSGTGSKDQCK